MPEAVLPLDARTADGHPALLDALFANAPAGLAFWDRELRYRRVNDALAAINGVAPDAHLGRTAPEVLGALGVEVEETIRRVLELKEPAADVEVAGETPAAPGEARHWLASYYPLVHGGEAIGVAGIVMEVTKQHRAEEERVRLLKDALSARAHAEAAQVRAEDAQGIAERARARTELLAEAARRMAASMDLETTLQQVAEVAVPTIADWCAISIAERTGELRTVAVAGGLPARAAASLSVPLRTSDGVLGVISLAMSHSGRAFDEDDTALATAVADRAALHVRNAQLYAERSHIARTLARSLLPRALPDIPGLEVAARYQAAGDQNDVGGDFYDVFPTENGVWVALIGDVTGKGPEAAALTSPARHTLRGAALHDGSPAENLRLLNRAMLADTASTRFCTVVYGRICPSPGTALVTLASGGHPPPLILRAGGELETVEVAGTLVGGVADPVFENVTVRLETGDLMLFYTDGVTELRTPDVTDGDGVLAASLRASAGRSAEEIVEAALRGAVEKQAGLPRDDIALLAFRVAPRGLDYAGMDRHTAERLASNEARFRQINSRLADDVAPLAEPEERIAFVCECSTPSCRETVELELDEYRAVRRGHRRFFIVEGHEIPEIERVLERNRRYAVVEKRIIPVGPG